MDIEKRTA